MFQTPTPFRIWNDEPLIRLIHRHFKVQDANRLAQFPSIIFQQYGIDRDDFIPVAKHYRNLLNPDEPSVVTEMIQLYLANDLSP